MMDRRSVCEKSTFLNGVEIFSFVGRVVILWELAEECGGWDAGTVQELRG
jgi:hypothetical protein